MRWSVLRSVFLTTSLCLFGASLAAQDKARAPEHGEKSTYKEGEVLEDAEAFFGKGAEGLAQALQKAFDDYGEPVAVIKGEEAGGAFAVGVRYGRGELVWKGGASRPVFWQGPSLGFDIGGNAAKVYTLVYGLPDDEALFQRFPGVEGSAYFIGGVGLNYNQSGDTVLAPVRLGVGWRLGASIGYMHFTKEKSWNPF